MSENAKTMIFVGAGLLAVVAALLTRPSAADLDVNSLVGETLTNKFNNPDDAKRLKIVRFDEDTATLREFEVAEEDGLWTIPSKDGYPADATRQMAEAAMSLKDRKILAVESNSASDHEQYGVIDPLSPKLVPGQKGVGARVTLSDSNDAPLVDLIIGKAPKNSEEQRYVREANRDVVYVIEIDPSKLSTKFDNWIEKDLLKLDPWDIKEVEIKDYSAQLVAGMRPDGQPVIDIELDPRSDLTLALDDAGDKWQVVNLKEGQPNTGQYTEFKLADDEELNEEKLNALKTAIDDLEIVDVARKPQGLSDDLKAGDDFMQNREALMDLMRRGFTPAQAVGGPGEIISSYGELVVTMKDGVEYVMRFGNLTDAAGADQGTQQKGASDGAAAGSDATKSSASDVHRYMFVMARHNESAVKKPELKPLPELPADRPAETEAAKSEEEAAEPGEESAKADDVAADEAKLEEPARDESAESAETTDEEKAEEAKADAEQPPDAKADEKDAKDATETPAETDKQKELDKVIAERKSIENENQRKLDEYQSTLTNGRDKVKDLNLRFGDWYFVVANDVFEKVRLGRDSVIKKKEAKKDDAAATSPAGAPGAAVPGLPPIPGTKQ